jgi:hypothetical protein
MSFTTVGRHTTKPFLFGPDAENYTAPLKHRQAGCPRPAELSGAAPCRRRDDALSFIDPRQAADEVCRER